MKKKSGNRKWEVGGGALGLLLVFLFPASYFLPPAFGQQPQPIYRANAEAVQGVGPGNWTYGADVNLYVSPSGSDTTGNGTSGAPYATITRALQDIPEFVSQHYIINLAAGTYPEGVYIAGHYFGTTINPFLSKAAIEIKGDPAAPDSYIISGADPGAPTTPVRDWCVKSAFQNVILNGISLQYARNGAGFYQLGGNALVISSTVRNSPNAGGIWQRHKALTEIRGTITMSDVWGGLLSDTLSFFSNENPSSNNGFWALFADSSLPVGSLTIGIAASGGNGITGAESSVMELGDVTITGPGKVADGSIGVLGWTGGIISVGNLTISGIDTAVMADSSSIIYSDNTTITNANTGALSTHNALIGWFATNPTFTGVTTPYSISNGGRVVGQSGLSLFDGNLTGTGDVNVTAGQAGGDHNVTLTPGGSGYTILNGKVRIGTASPQAVLDVAGQDRRDPVAFSALTACSTTIEGETAAITDSATATWGATITGGGANHVLGYCDGTHWTVAAM
jgi:hypothetical protein